MPIAAVDPQKYERHELTSLEGAYVMLRPLPYGKKVERRAKSSKMSMRQDGPQDRQPKGGNAPVLELQQLEDWTTQFDFAYCIGEHNLQNLDGSPINFSTTLGWAMLDPRVGSEIEEILFKLNEGEDQETLEDFTKRATPLPSEEATLTT